MEKKLEIGEIVYMTTYRNLLESKIAKVVHSYGLDEFDEDERELYKVVGEDGNSYVYHYPSMVEDYFYLFTRGEYINKVDSLTNNKRTK